MNLYRSTDTLFYSTAALENSFCPGILDQVVVRKETDDLHQT